MKKSSKISLVFSGLFLLSFAVAQYLVGGWIHFFWILIAGSVGSFGAAIYNEWAIIKEFFTMKTTKKGLNMGMTILLVLGCLIVVNIISVRHYKVFDFSSAKQNTLSEQSIHLLKDLDSDLTVLFFYKNGAEGNEESRKGFRELIKRYQDVSSHVLLQFVEVNERPDLAQEFNVTEGGGVAFLTYKGRKNRVERIEEQEITSALLKVTQETEKIIYVLQGHKEMDVDDTRDINGLGSFKNMLSGNRYQVKNLILNQTAKVPADASALVIAGPQQAFLELELNAIRAYLRDGGKVLVAVKAKTAAGLDKLLPEFGVTLGQNYIFNLVDTMMGQGVNQGETMGSIFSSNSDITKIFGKGQIVRMRYPQSLKVAVAQEGLQTEELVLVSKSSMAFADLDMKKEGPKGPFAVAVSVKGRLSGMQKDFSLIAIGDPDILGNQLLYQNLNRDLVLNSIASLAGDQKLISIAPREVGVTQMTLTPTKLYLFVFAFLIPLPLAFLIVSIVFWLRRRNA